MCGTVPKNGHLVADQRRRATLRWAAALPATIVAAACRGASITQDSPVTPEMFGAVGDGRHDDTAAVQAALDRGGEVVLSHRYASRGNRVSVPGTQITGNGTLLKRIGSEGPLLAIVADDVSVTLGGLSGFNGRCTAYLSGDEMHVATVEQGVLRLRAPAPKQPPSGTPVDGDGIAPGTMIVADLGMRAGRRVYRINRPHDLSMRQIRFVDAIAFWWRNDLLRNSGQRTRLRIGLIEGSAGNGIASMAASGLTITGTRIRCVHDNGIVVADAGSDGITIRDVTIEGSCTQNGIFLTASAGSVANGRFIRGARIERCTVGACGDTALEIGYHSINAVVRDCVLGPSVNPPLLWRDCQGAVCERLTLHAPPIDRQSQDWCAFAVVPQFEPATWSYAGQVNELRFEGAVRGAVARIGGSGITLSGLAARSPDADRPAGSRRGSFVSLAGNVQDITLRNSSAAGYSNAIQMNYGARQVQLRAIHVNNNRFENFDIIVNDYRTVFVNSVFTYNRLSGGRLFYSQDVLDKNIPGLLYAPNVRTRSQ